MSGDAFTGTAVNSPEARAAQRAEFLDARLRKDGCDEPTFSRALLLVAELDGLDDVAKACGVGTDFMRRQLNGTRPLHFESVLQVTRALGVQLRVEAKPA
jgi:DNA-binding phage protein